MELNVTYLHKHSFTPSAASSSMLRKELADAEIALHHKRPGMLISSNTSGFAHFKDAALSTVYDDGNTATPSEPSEPPNKALKHSRLSTKAMLSGVIIAKYNIQVLVKDIPDPPNILYSKNYWELVTDWGSDSSPATVVMNGIKIPLCDWDKVYKNHRPAVWETWKGRWRNWHVRYYRRRRCEIQC
jgi:hypothetical protein